MTCACLGDFCSNAENWGNHRKNNFFIHSVELSMCDGPIETARYIWVNILYMLDWIFSQNCRNSLPLHTAVQLARSTKSSKLSYLTKCLQSTPSSVFYQIEEYKNISLVTILHCLNSFKSTLQLCGIFIIHIYCLGKTTT